jgi:predicted Rdx family selenoprotein
LAEGRVRETSIALTPVGDGRFEIYLDGNKVYDRKEPSENDFVPKLKVLRKVALELNDLFEEKVAT